MLNEDRVQESDSPKRDRSSMQVRPNCVRGVSGGLVRRRSMGSIRVVLDDCRWKNSWLLSFPARCQLRRTAETKMFVDSQHRNTTGGPGTRIGLEAERMAA